MCFTRVVSSSTRTLYSTPLTSLIESAEASGLSRGDFDGDADIDIAYKSENESSGEANLSYVDAAGNAVRDIAEPHSIGGMADMDGDGDQDIVYKESSLANIVFRDANGNRQMTKASSMPVPLGLTGDFNIDGTPQQSYIVGVYDKIRLINANNQTHILICKSRSTWRYRQCPRTRDRYLNPFLAELVRLPDVGERYRQRMEQNRDPHRTSNQLPGPEECHNHIDRYRWNGYEGCNIRVRRSGRKRNRRRILPLQW